MDLKGKVAVVTGVSKGIGYHLSRNLLEKGVRVFGLGRNNNDIEDPAFHFINCDVRDRDSVDGAFSKIGSLSEGQIDILVNNAGLGYFGYLEDITPEQWHEMMDTNLNGIYYCTRQVLPSMKTNQSGHIINIASTAALEGMPQVSAYCASKWAVKGLSESLYKELRDFKIKVTCIYPGSVMTDFFRNSKDIKPHPYMLMPGDVSQCIIQALQMPDNFHTVNLEVRPLQPKGPKIT